MTKETSTLRENTFKGTTKIVIIGMVDDYGLFIINDSQYITINKKSLESFTEIICSANMPAGNGIQMPIIFLSDTTREVQCLVQLKNNTLVTSLDGNEIKITDNLLESFKLTAFIKTFLLLNQQSIGISSLKKLNINSKDKDIDNDDIYDYNSKVVGIK